MRTWIGITAGISAIGVSLVFASTLKADKMSEIKVDVGRNIVDIARQSGVSKFSTRNIVGLIRYSINDLPNDLPVRFIKPGYDASFTSIFALSLYADEEFNNNLAVNTVALQFSTSEIRNHKEGQLFVESIISKFGNKKWKRHIPELCPAITGRSNFIHPNGSISDWEGCPLDPDYHINEGDWRELAIAGHGYEWIGDGTVATLTVNSSEDSRGVTYILFLEYEIKLIRQKYRDKNLAYQLSKGDAAGWNSTSKHHATLKSLRKKMEDAEREAVKRGDKIIPRS